MPSRNKPAKNFTGAMYQLSSVMKLTEGTVGLETTSVTDDFIDWPPPPEQNSCLCYTVGKRNWFFHTSVPQ